MGGVDLPRVKCDIKAEDGREAGNGRVEGREVGDGFRAQKGREVGYGIPLDDSREGGNGRSNASQEGDIGSGHEGGNG